MSHSMKRMTAVFVITALILMQVGVLVYADTHDRTVLPEVRGKTLYAQPKGERAAVAYTSIIRLEHQPNPEDNGKLLATFYSDLAEKAKGNAVFLSEDDGYTWTGPISYVRQTQVDPEHYVLHDPRLYELPQDVGDLKAGTIIYAGRSFGQNGTWYFGCQIQLYYSTDAGHTWEFLSTVHTTGDEAFGAWEPHVMVAENGQLVVYWSDELTVPDDDQTIVHKASDDGINWGPLVHDVIIPGKRPGMPTVVKMDNGKYVMSYEVVRDRASLIRVKFSDDGLNWGDPYDPGLPVETATGAYLGATPYMTWIPGTQQLVVSGAFVFGDPSVTTRKLFVNNNYGLGKWEMIDAPVQWQGHPERGQGHGVGYVQAMIPTADGNGIIHLSPSYAAENQNYILYGRSDDINPINDQAHPDTYITITQKVEEE